MIIDTAPNGMLIRTDVDGASFYLVIDSLLRDTSSGGLRITEDLDISEVEALAREMTLKFSFIGLQRGGAKSGLKIPPGTDAAAKKAILKAVGARIGGIIRKGIYYPGMDMNCGPDDLRALYRGAGINVGTMTDTSFFTAISVTNSIEACVESDTSGKKTFTIAVEGFGSVAAYLAERLPVDRFRFVAISTIAGAKACQSGFSAATLVAQRKQSGDDFVNHLTEGDSIDRQSLFAIPADILVPSARTWSLDDAVARTVQARYVVPAANAPYTGESVRILEERGIVCLPGYVVNCGGVYASSLHDSGVARQQIEEISSNGYRRVVAALLKRSRESGLSPLAIAESVAKRRFAAQASGGQNRTLWDKLYDKARGTGVVPGSMHAGKVLGSFRRNLEKLVQQLQEWQP